MIDLSNDLSHLPRWGQLLIAVDTAVVAFMAAHGFITYVVTPLF